MSIQVTSQGFDELARALQSAEERAPEEFAKVVGQGCNNIKRDWRRRWSGLKHAPALPYAISYDVTKNGTKISGEVGPDKAKRQGALGNLLEYGSIHNAPIPGGSPALDKEEPVFVKYCEQVAARLIEEA